MIDKTKRTKPETATIAVAVKTFGNNKSFEGLRVKAGQRFAIEKAQGGLPVMSLARFNSLKSAGLVRGLGELDMLAAPGKREFRNHVVYAHQGEVAEANRKAVDAKPDGEKKAATRARKAVTKAPAAPGEVPPKRDTVRAASKKKTQESEPPAPSRITGRGNPTGSRTGAATPESSSPAVLPVTSSSFQKRGTRRG